MATPTTLPAAFVSGNILTAAQMNDLRGAFRILQVQQVTKLDTFTTASTSFTDVTGLSITITPSSTTNKILFMMNIGAYGNGSGNFGNQLQLLRGSTNILEPTGGTFPGATQTFDPSSNFTAAVSMTMIDSPATTSATTYKIQCRANGGNTFVNRLAADANFTAVSTLIVMEISA